MVRAMQICAVILRSSASFNLIFPICKYVVILFLTLFWNNIFLKWPIEPKLVHAFDL